MEKVTEKELVARAKKLYFDKNPKIKSIYVDDFGRFSYNKGTLLELNKITKAGVYHIDRNAIKGVQTDDVNDFSVKEAIQKHFPSAKVKEKEVVKEEKK